MCVKLILGAETYKAGEGYPSPREGQLSPCLLCGYHLTHSLSPTHCRPSPGKLAPGFHISADTASLLSHHLHSLHFSQAHRHCEKLSSIWDPSTIFRSALGQSSPLLLCLVVPVPWMEAGGCSRSRAGSSACRSFPATPTAAWGRDGSCPSSPLQQKHPLQPRTLLSEQVLEAGCCTCLLTPRGIQLALHGSDRQESCCLPSNWCLS